MKKSDREIMEILEAYDATESAHSAAQLAGVDPKTVRRYVAARDQGRPVTGAGSVSISAFRFSMPFGAFRSASSSSRVFAIRMYPFDIIP